MNEMQAKFSGGASDAYRLIGATSPLTRRDQSPLGSMLGPTYSRLEGLAGAAGDAVKGILPGDKPTRLDGAGHPQTPRDDAPAEPFRISDSSGQAEDGIDSALGVPHRARDGKQWNPRSSYNAITQANPIETPAQQ